MTRTIQFTKMHGAGNDYIYINAIKYPIADPEKRAVEWSAYHTGIGSDGLVLIDTSDKADFSMRIFNADGQKASRSGIPVPLFFLRGSGSLFPVSDNAPAWFSSGR